MLIPTIKAPPIDRHLTEVFGYDREQSILDETCVSCKEVVTNLPTETYAKEYEISGLCKECQDEVFEGEE